MQSGSGLSLNMEGCVIWVVTECLGNLSQSCSGIWEAEDIGFCNVSSSGMTFVYTYSVSHNSYFHEFILCRVSDILFRK